MITKRISDCLDDEIFCDIIELKSIFAGHTGLDMMDVQRDLDIELSETDDEGTNNNDTAEIIFNDKNELLQTRIARVGEENYPFDLSDDGSRFTLKPCITNSGYIYLFCLLLSHPKEDDVLSGFYLPNINDSERRLFQLCSTVAAAGVIAGNAISFGFPRPDRSGFYDKLKQVFSFIQDGKIRETLLPGTPTNIKDFEMDVIAWLHRQDAQILERYFLAQAASGLNWEDKPLSSDKIDEFHDLFFSDRPKKIPERGIFIPFIFEYDSKISLEEKLRLFSTIYGEFHYRFSIPRNYAKGHTISKQNDNMHIDGVSSFDEIKLWVCAEIDKIREMAFR